MANELAELRNRGLFYEFVQKKQGDWNHSDWLEFLEKIRKEGCASAPDDAVGVELENAKREFWAKYKELLRAFVNEKKAAWTDADVAAFSEHLRRSGYTFLTNGKLALSLEADRRLYWEELKKFQSSGTCREFVNRKQGAWNHSDWLGFVEEVRKAGFNFLTDAEIGFSLEAEKSEYWKARQRHAEIRPVTEKVTPGMMTIQDLTQLEQLKNLINEAQSLLVVNFPRHWSDLKSFESKLREACRKNNEIYSSRLPQEVAVSSEITLFLAINMSHAQQHLKAAEGDMSASWSVFKAMGSVLLATFAPSPSTILGAGKSIHSHINKSNAFYANILKAKDELDPITWRYLLTYKDGAFLLRRGVWEVHFKREHRGSMLPPVTLYELRLVKVGIDPALSNTHEFKSIPNLPALQIGEITYGREGITSSGWEQ